MNHLSLLLDTLSATFSPPFTPVKQKHKKTHRWITYRFKKGAANGFYHTRDRIFSQRSGNILILSLHNYLTILFKTFYIKIGTYIKKWTHL